MRFFDKIFGIQKFHLEIMVPAGIEIVHMVDKVRFRGTKEGLSKFAKEFYRLKKLSDGQLCKLEKYTLKVSGYMTPDREKENWIELPNHAWGVMGSKFNEVANSYEDNPFDFNDCGYTSKNLFDIGVEVTDLSIRLTEFNDELLHKQQQLDCNAADFKFDEPKNLATFTTRQWLEEKKPILKVVHDNNGDWQFLTGDQYASDIKIVLLEELIKSDNTLNEVFDLEYGEEAEREFIGGPWTRKKVEYQDEE